jgi:hypothetical protein
MRNSIVLTIQEQLLLFVDCNDSTKIDCWSLLHGKMVLQQMTSQQHHQGLHHEADSIGYCYYRMVLLQQIPSVAVVDDDIAGVRMMMERACNAGSDCQCPLRRSLVMLRILP